MKEPLPILPSPLSTFKKIENVVWHADSYQSKDAKFEYWGSGVERKKWTDIAFSIFPNVNHVEEERGVDQKINPIFELSVFELVRINMPYNVFNFSQC